MTFDKLNAQHRATMRELIGDGIGIDFTNLGEALGCHPSLGPVLVALDELDVWDEVTAQLRGEVAQERHDEWWAES